MGEFGNSIGELSGSDLSKQLSHSLVVMSDVQKRAGDLQNAQAQEDIDTFMSTGPVNNGLCTRGLIAER